MLIAEVAFPLPLHRTFDYAVPQELAARALPGARVRAPFGPRRLAGVLVGVRDGLQDRPLKDLEEVHEPLWGPDMIDLARWLSKRYCAPLGECLAALMPKYVGRPARDAVEPPRPSLELGPRFELNEEQAAALERLASRLSERRFGAALVLGVPASGKTEVYLRLLERVAAEGGQALFLVPEIALTHPFLDEFAARLPVPVASWHSRGSMAAKKRDWAGFAKGRPGVLVGARSAALVPLPNLRLVVVDEEQDESYKQDETSPTYHAREVAVERARRAGALVVLGSATPSLESYRKALEGEWELVRLTRGVQQKQRPVVTVLDRRQHGEDLVCPELAAELQRSLQEKEQAILVVNRRGFSPLTLCRKCGWLAKCRLCGIAMVLHHVGGRSVLRCHHCEAQEGPPSQCPNCKKGGHVKGVGAGTQRAEAEARALLPEARVLRFDRDSLKAGKESSALYRRFKKLEADVLVGTRLVSKGYHFPEVTLVGIVDADAMLHMPDFRGAEKTFQLLVQAAGRAGRAQKPGRVLLQTFHPDHYAIQAAVTGDFDAFARQELEFRKELGYPPYGSLLRLVLSGPDEAKVAEEVEQLAVQVRQALASNVTEILGPAQAFYRQLRGRYRYHLMVKVRRAAALDGCLDFLRTLVAPSGLRLKVQVDPYDLF